MYLLTVTVPGRETRPRSFRPRSTSITCSARSFGSRWSCSARIRSSSGVAPRGRVPAIGCVVSLSPSSWTSSSGLAPTTSNAGTRTKNRYGLGLTRRRLLYSPIPSSCLPVAGSAGRSNDWRRASTTWIASPAAIASFATSTAWTYSSRPSEASAARPCDRGAASSLPLVMPVRASAAPRELPPARSELPPTGAVPISAADGRAVRSSASKIASSAIRYRPSRSGTSVCSDAIADNVWVR